MQEYSNYCLATEQKACEETRWKLHRKTLEVHELLKLENFSKLYSEPRFKKHFGRLGPDTAHAEAFVATAGAADPLQVD